MLLAVHLPSIQQLQQHPLSLLTVLALLLLTTMTLVSLPLLLRWRQGQESTLWCWHDRLCLFWGLLLLVAASGDNATTTEASVDTTARV